MPFFSPLLGPRVALASTKTPFQFGASFPGTSRKISAYIKRHWQPRACPTQDKIVATRDLSLFVRMGTRDSNSQASEQKAQYREPLKLFLHAIRESGVIPRRDLLTPLATAKRPATGVSPCGYVPYTTANPLAKSSKRVGVVFLAERASKCG